MDLNAFEWKPVSFGEKHSTKGYFYSRCEKRRCNSICGFAFLYVWRNDFIGLDLTFLSYNMCRLIITKCYENLKWMVTMKVQRIARHFAILTFCYILLIWFWNLCSFSSFIEETSSAYFILLWWIIRRDMEVSSETPFLLVYGNQSSILLPCCFCGFPSSMSAAFVWRAFSKIKHLPHWQLFWIFICQTLHIQTT